MTHAIPQTVLFAEGTVTYPPEMGIADQKFVMRSSNHPENGLPDGGGPSSAHAALHEAAGMPVEDCPGSDCTLHETS
jgi:hypothetical protein